ncbi:conserved hypothetical protein [Sulfolobus islandicus Y.G.57.14]|jgi:hypothetical protein|uniref:DUF1955 domain-containing protein n=4 Tax=Saccharolobus islandicus TaxID=43080 RepID=C3MPM3_SACI2|nr:DUF1955 domain-containing protein [Sulfolobus islandicus]ACP35336.1 Domain of unknown function DUF1955 [Sulfolobus islandicus L.S.2.15]ACP45492.1 conserved hypothetical protein [Sulfolobus islandicus Y.G.57.14]ACP48710.1 conserved hypothetical protein [Sulfolobus islandicus Y.N.15.51]ADB87020.1 conserved hypothetical protein [Sulfolobus islandicus L.D.8.5]PVU78551.1 DUF1955 domain-containing protein [Sulfolobus islandicus]
MSESQELRRKLIEAKKLILDGFVEQGIELLSKTITSENIKESNWIICNVIDTADCDAVVKTLDSIGKIFDMSPCANIKRIVYCYALVNKASEYVDLALDIIVKSNKKDALDKLYNDLKNEKINPEFLLKIGIAYKKLGAVKESNEVLRKACENGLKEACENIKEIASKIM